MYQKVIFCNCLGGAIDENVKSKIIDLLHDLNTEKLRLFDLCGLCVTDKDQVKELFLDERKTLLIACHPRAVKLLLEYAGVEVPDNLSILDLHEVNEDSFNKIIEEFRSGDLVNNSIKEINSNSDWPAWYPIIDYSRCSSCGQCADFCLFGVYSKINGTVKVINPASCKTNCPACARICPQTAIVFPKYQLAGAISGSDSFDEVSEQKRQLDDMHHILGGDVYQALENRKLKRQSIIKGDAMKKAMEEREKALKENKKG